MPLLISRDSLREWVRVFPSLVDGLILWLFCHTSTTVLTRFWPLQRVSKYFLVILCFWLPPIGLVVITKSLTVFFFLRFSYRKFHFVKWLKANTAEGCIFQKYSKKCELQISEISSVWFGLTLPGLLKTTVWLRDCDKLWSIRIWTEIIIIVCVDETHVVLPIFVNWLDSNW